MLCIEKCLLNCEESKAHTAVRTEISKTQMVGKSDAHISSILLRRRSCSARTLRTWKSVKIALKRKLKDFLRSGRTGLTMDRTESFMRLLNSSRTLLNGATNGFLL